MENKEHFYWDVLYTIVTIISIKGINRIEDFRAKTLSTNHLGVLIP